jgi:hypothetical protein
MTLPLVPLLNTAFSYYMNCQQQLSYDEKRVRCKAHSAWYKFNKEKPIKRAFQFMSISCPCCGYEVYFQPDCSKAADDKLATNKTEAMVMDMTRPLTGKNHVLWMDNFFNGVPLLVRLALKDIFAGGTLRKNRKYLPPAIKAKAAFSKVRGEMQGFYTQFNRPNAEPVTIAVEQWVDNKLVSLLSNFMPGKTTVLRKSKSRSADKLSNVWTTAQLPSPTTVPLYNNGMGGCDRGDQAMAYYLRHMQCKRPYVILFFYFFLTAANDARILHGKVHGKGGVPLTGKAFLMRLKDEMLAKGRAWKAEGKEEVKEEGKEEGKEEVWVARRRKLIWWAKQPAVLRLEGLHTPKVAFKLPLPPKDGKPRFFDPRGYCIVCSVTRKAHKKRGEPSRPPPLNESAIAKAQRLAGVRKTAPPASMMLGSLPTSSPTKTGEMCKQCDVFLCFSRDDESPCCFDLWHNTLELNELRA